MPNGTRDEMVAKREEIMARYRVLRSVPGSGYHDNDSTGPVKTGEPAVDGHVVAFKLPFETLFVGPDSMRAREAIQNYAIRNSELLKELRLDFETRVLIETALEYAGLELKDECYVIRNAQWNAVLAILGLEKIGVTSTAV